MKVSTNEDMHASLKALRRDDAESSFVFDMGIAVSGSISFSGVGEIDFDTGAASLDFSPSVVLRYDSAEPWLTPCIVGTALIARVISQSKSSGLTREMATVTISPVIMLARHPASVVYSIPVVATVISP